MSLSMPDVHMMSEYLIVSTSQASRAGMRNNEAKMGDSE
jgi:hypothetical protein